MQEKGFITTTKAISRVIVKCAASGQVVIDEKINKRPSTNIIGQDNMNEGIVMDYEIDSEREVLSIVVSEPIFKIIVKDTGTFSGNCSTKTNSINKKDDDDDRRERVLA